jgi:triacylglycerol esterase/lipase EstA (alpha/beta hydrolase family)
LAPAKEVGLLAHSLGGLIARSYLQEFETPHPPLVLITLATPHHGTNIANDFDPTRLMTSLYWDRYDDSDEAERRAAVPEWVA